MGQSLGARSAIPERLCPGCLAHALGDESLRPSHQPAYEPHPIVGDEGIVGGMVDVGLDHGRVGPEFPSSADLERPCQLHRTIVESSKGWRTDRIRPTDEGGVVGGALQVQAAELPQDDRIAETKRSVSLAPPVELLEHHHPQDDLHRFGVSPEPLRVEVAFKKICLKELEEFIVFEQPLELYQLGFELELGEHLEEVHGIVSIDYH